MRLFLLLFMLSGCTSLPEKYEDKRAEVKAFCEKIAEDIEKENNFTRSRCLTEGFKLSLRCQAPFPLSIFLC